MIKTLKIGKKSQIVLPVSIRKKLHISEGDEIIIHSIGNTIVLVPKPKRYADHMKGLHAEMWEDENPDLYVNKLREEWKNSNTC
jgi:AbrB family looped-hinge helix DNA binding protein